MAAACSYRLVGYDSDAELFDIEDCGSGGSTSPSTVRRSLRDLQALSRQQKRKTTPPLPTQHARKLQSKSWRLEGAGWEANQKKAVASLGAWLTEVLGASEGDVKSTFLDEASYQQRQQQIRERVEREAPARALQQYFASAANIATMTALLAQVLTKREQSSREQRLVVVEPSFGDGRLLKALASCLTARTEQTLLVGVEIDPVVSASARERFASTAAEVEPQLHIGDFLTTTREQLLAGGGAAESFQEDAVFIVVGSPPYTQGGGTGSLTTAGNASLDTGRDLPLQFLIHSAAVLRAQVIVFLMPQRSGREDAVSRALHEMQQASGSSFRLAEQHEASSEFEFVGRKVAQPAVVQVFERF